MLASATRSPHAVRIYLGLLLGIGTSITLYGLFVVPAMPYVQLDAVLTPSELADPAQQKAILDLFIKAQTHAWVLPTLTGAIVSAISAMGLFASKPGAKP